MTISPTNTRFTVVKTNKQGLQNTSVTNGSVYFVADTQELFFDFDSSRVKVTDILILQNEAARTSILFSPLNKFYFVLDSQKLYLYKDGTWYEVSGSGSITIDDVLSTTSTNAVQNKVVTAALNTKQTTSNLVTSIDSNSTDVTYPSSKCVYNAIADAEYDVEVISDTDGDVVVQGVTNPTPYNFIPRNTVITVETDGSGDFTKLSDAVAYLTGKWSNGVVKIQLGNGTFTESGTVYIDGVLFNIPLIQILGNGITNTIIQGSSASNTYLFNSVCCDVELVDLKWTNSYGTKQGRGVISSVQSRLTANNIHVDNVEGFGIGASFGGETLIANSCKLTNMTAAIFAEQGGTIKTSWGCQITATNVYNLFNVMSGFVYGAYPNIIATNVTNIYSQNNREITKNGLIMVCTSS